jgi:uncharacterized repeat protein (TIGR01451 family)
MTKQITGRLVTTLALLICGLAFVPTGWAAGLARADAAPLGQQSGPACKLYAVDDITQNDSQIFTIDFNTHAVTALGPIHTDLDLEGLDFHSTTHQFYAASGLDNAADSRLYLVAPMTGTLTLMGEIEDAADNGFREVASLSFRPDGTLWAFARRGDATRRGIIQFDDLATATAHVDKQSTLDIEAIAWSLDGSTLWLATGRNLYSYTPGGDIVLRWTFGSDPGDPLHYLPDEIEGLEFRPDGLLMAGMDNGASGLNVYALDIVNGVIVTSDGFGTPTYDDVESLAWPEWCISQIGDRVWRDQDVDGLQDESEPDLVGVMVNLYNDTDDDGVFEPGGDDDLLTSQTIAASGLYTFSNLLPGKYFVEVDKSNFDLGEVLEGYAATLRDVGADEAIDSDGALDTFATHQIDLAYNVMTPTWDMGFFSPAIQITKQADQTLPPGATAHFTITVSNVGEGTLMNVTVTDAQAPGCARDVGTLLPGVQSSYTCTQTNVTADLTNLAAVAADTPTGGTVGDTDTATVDVLPTITVDKTASPTSLPEPGGVATFTVRVNNTSAEAVTLTALVDDVHGDLHGQGDCATGGSIAAGSYYECSFSATVSGNAGDSETDTVTATASDDESNPASAQDSATVTITAIHPDIAIVKTADPEIVHAGDMVSYTYVVTNPGDDPLSTVSVSDDKCSPVEFMGGDLDSDDQLDLDESWVYTCSTALSEDTTNTATVTAADSLGQTVSAQDTAFVEVINPAIEVVKTVTPGAIMEGEPALWTITVYNRGDTPLYSVTVTDSNGMTFGPLTLAADDGDDGGGGDQMTWGYETYPAADTTNLAAASGVDSLALLVSDQDQASVTVTLYEDSDDDGMPNYLDPDDDGDGIPDADECPGGPPCDDNDGDGVPDYLDPDDDGDGVPTADECPGGPPCDDNDGDGVPDYLDPDDDGDGMPTADECPGGPPCDDSDGDGAPDYLDPDDDGDGVPTANECPGGPPCDDDDGDGVPDYLDPDDDGDGIPTTVECPGGPPCDDSDDDGAPDYLDPDSDGDGIPDSVEAGDDPADPLDSDGDGLPDYLDLDSDDDGLPDAGEWSEGPDDPLAGCSADDPLCFDNDADGDGIPNYLDPDSDGDGIPDSQEGLQDGDEDGIPDWLDPNSQPQETHFYVFLPLLGRNH